jgi:hypothetical protein
MRGSRLVYGRVHTLIEAYRGGLDHDRQIRGVAEFDASATQNKFVAVVRAVAISFTKSPANAIATGTGGYALYSLSKGNVIDDVISGLVRRTHPLRNPFSLIDEIAGKKVPKPCFVMLFSMRANSKFLPKL